MPEQVDIIDSKFRFILIAAKRARQLQGGAKPLVLSASRKPTRIAQEEIRAGLVKWELVPIVIKPAPAENAAEKKSKK